LFGSASQKVSIKNVNFYDATCFQAWELEPSNRLSFKEVRIILERLPNEAGSGVLDNHPEA
jgi:hypothetical protein